MPALAEEGIQKSFLEALAACEGNLAKASGMIGLSRQAIYRHMSRENEFRALVGITQSLAIQGKAAEILDGTYGHIENHIKDGWEYVTDDDGNQVYETDPKSGKYRLDDDLEMIPVKRSIVSLKSLEGLAREMRHATQGEKSLVQINNDNTVQVKPPRTAPPVGPPGSTVLDDDVLDAEYTEIDQGAEL